MHTLREREVQAATGSSSNLQTESYRGCLLQADRVTERQAAAEREILTETDRKRCRGRAADS